MSLPGFTRGITGVGAEGGPVGSGADVRVFECAVVRALVGQ